MKDTFCFRKMPREYVHDPRRKLYKKIDHQQLLEALNSIRRGMSYRNAAEKYGIHYSVLYRHHKNPGINKQGGQPELSDVEENKIVDLLVACSEWGYPLDRYDLRMIAGSLNNVFVSYLKTMRFGDTSLAQKTRRKKIKVPAGKSVTGADFASSEDEAEEMSLHDSSVADMEEELMEAEEQIIEQEEMEQAENYEDMLPLSEIRNKLLLSDQVIESDENGVYKDGKYFKNVYLISKEEIQQSTWLLVGFDISTFSQKKNKYYIGKVIRSVDGEFEGSFLRPRPTKNHSGYIYVFPDVPDVCLFTYEQVVGILYPVEPNQATIKSCKRDLLRFMIPHNTLQ